MGNQQDAYDQWADKQRAMGRPTQQPIVPIPEIYLGPQPKGCVNRDPSHLEQFTAAECAAYDGANHGND